MGRALHVGERREWLHVGERKERMGKWFRVKIMQERESM